VQKTKFLECSVQRISQPDCGYLNHIHRGQWPGDRDVAMTPKLLEAARLSEQNRFAIEIIR
jgi:hypothetical protein